ncbi:MAG TPA: sugar phosphate isomerase/epimerase [Tepidisphaeraceae bacterium]|jgi:sugar phosphate isomerase/epimerase
MNHPTRRHFLRTASTLAAGAALAPRLFAADEAPKKKIPIAVQLYSVRNELKTDFNGVIEKIGKMGFQAVEFASLQERTRNAKELRKLLDDNGLKCCGTHTPLQTLQGDALKVTIDLHKTLGNTFLICPSMSAKTAENWVNLAKQFNEIAARCKEEGMFTGYHSHAGDFTTKFDGKTAWEIFFDNTMPDVIHQIDVGNTMSGGGDPIAMIKKYPGRTKSTHIKEHGGAKDAAIGEGQIDWKTLLNTYETVGGTEWYIVEYENGNPLEKIKTCLDNLHKMGR